MKYIYQGKILDYGKDISESVAVSTDYSEQQTKHVSLSSEQIAFHEANPTASVQEVWNCALYVATTPTDEEIRILRQEAYKARSDNYYMAYQKYMALGDTAKAEESRIAWLTEIAVIDSEFPYLSE